MKKLLIFILFIGFSVNAQNPSLFRNGIDTKFIQIDTLTTTQRDALTIPNNKSAIIYNSTVGSLQYKSPDGSWENIGGGDVESVQGKTGDVVLDPDDLDDTSTTNKFVTATEKGLIGTALQPSAISNEAYNATTWNGVDTIAPSKDAVRDKFASIDNTLSNVVTTNTIQNINASKTFNSGLTINTNGDNQTLRFTGGFSPDAITGPAIGRTSTNMFFRFNSSGDSSTRSAIMDGSLITTTNKTYTWPNKSGTIALLDDISGGGTTMSADSVFVSPTIRGIDNAYDLLYAYKTSIDSIQSNMNTGVNTAFRTVTSISGVFAESYDSAQPNFQLTLDEDVEIEITDVVNGDFLIAELYNDDVSEDDFLVTLKGTNEDLTANIHFGERAYFTMITNADDDIVWLRSYEKGYKPTSVINSATIYMDGDSVYDDTTDDASTITLSNCDPGETLKVYINRASAPTLAGTDLVFNQLPNTTAFESATDMVITFIVTPLLDSGDKVIDYYYTER